VSQRIIGSVMQRIDRGLQNELKPGMYPNGVLTTIAAKWAQRRWDWRTPGSSPA